MNTNQSDKQEGRMLDQQNMGISGDRNVTDVRWGMIVDMMQPKKIHTVQAEQQERSNKDKIGVHKPQAWQARNKTKAYDLSALPVLVVILQVSILRVKW